MTNVADFASHARKRGERGGARAKVDVPVLARPPRVLFLNLWFTTEKGFPSTGRAMTFDTAEQASKSAHDWATRGLAPDLISVRVMEPKEGQRGR